MSEWLQSVFGSNALLSGGLTLALLGLLAVWLRDVPGRVMRLGQAFPGHHADR